MKTLTSIRLLFAQPYLPRCVTACFYAIMCFRVLYETKPLAPPISWKRHFDDKTIRNVSLNSHTMAAGINPFNPKFFCEWAHVFCFLDSLMRQTASLFWKRFLKVYKVMCFIPGLSTTTSGRLIYKVKISFYLISCKNNYVVDQSVTYHLLSFTGGIKWVN